MGHTDRQASKQAAIQWHRHTTAEPSQAKIASTCEPREESMRRNAMRPWHQHDTNYSLSTWMWLVFNDETGLPETCRARDVSCDQTHHHHPPYIHETMLTACIKTEHAKINMNIIREMRKQKNERWKHEIVKIVPIINWIQDWRTGAWDS